MPSESFMGAFEGFTLSVKPAGELGSVSPKESMSPKERCPCLDGTASLEKGKPAIDRDWPSAPVARRSVLPDDLRPPCAPGPEHR